MDRKRSRKVSGKGAMTIPADVRHKLPSLAGGYVDITINGAGQLVMTPFTRECTFCGQHDPKHVFKGLGICDECRGGIIAAGEGR